MKFLKTPILTTIILAIGILFFACDDDDTKPITLLNYDSTILTLNYPNEKENVFVLQGGDGNYSVTSGDDRIITAKIIPSLELSLLVIGLGETTVTITDNSSNKLVLTITVDYMAHKFVVKHHDIAIVGDDLTANEKKAISEKYLAQIPVKVGGGYKFIFDEAPYDKGKAIVYLDSYGKEGIETSFEMVEIKNEQYPEGPSAWAYEISIDGQKRTFIRGVYSPAPLKRMPEPTTAVLMEDLTKTVQAEYPTQEIERVYTSQVIVRPAN